jgi:hypothetical protein
MNESLLTIWNEVRSVPQEAQKKISGGRLNGKTDINPVWRLKTLTGMFGPCGVGWKYEINKLWTEKGEAGEIAAFVIINLYIKNNGGWSEAIPGIGGSMFVAKETKGLYTSDECYKMALTDAISVSCKALGIAADVYWSADSSKYDKPDAPPAKPTAKPETKTAPTSKINDEQFANLAKACQAWGPEQEKQEQARLKVLYQRHGYKSARDIDAKDYAAIYREFTEYGLPEGMESEGA